MMQPDYFTKAAIAEAASHSRMKGRVLEDRIAVLEAQVRYLTEQVARLIAKETSDE
jgi:hypothetical protein